MCYYYHYCYRSILTETVKLHPSLLLSISNDFLYIAELTVGFETCVRNNAKRKKQMNKDLEISFKSKYKQVKFVNVVLSTLGVFHNSSVDFSKCLKTWNSTKHTGITQ